MPTREPQPSGLDGRQTQNKRHHADLAADGEASTASKRPRRSLDPVAQAVDSEVQRTQTAGNVSNLYSCSSPPQNENGMDEEYDAEEQLQQRTVGNSAAGQQQEVLSHATFFST